MRPHNTVNFVLIGNMPFLSLRYFNASLEGSRMGGGFLDIPTGAIPYGNRSFENISVSHYD